ncbi:MAG: hypothetical protein E3J54_01560 [Actinobacteria bacterium]|nr:MAG: hypothetical protein E3J54_01560 [Actinomycetota bacterium]
MDGTCSWCKKKSPFLHAVEVKVLSFNEEVSREMPEVKPICPDCEEDLKEYELSWEVISH